jgi:tetratricopeptide (TPR) repeat protein
LVEETDIARYLMTEVHKCLTKEEQTVMVAIAILLGYRGTRNAIEAILDAGAWEALTSLGNRYLLSVAEGPHGREYGQHAIFQTFYYNQLGRRQQREMHRRAGAYYEREEPDLLKAASHFQRAGDPEAAARLATADVWALINQGQAGALRRLLEQFTPQQMGAELWARVNIARGQVYALHRESQLARQSFEQGLAVLEGMADSPEFRELASKQRDRTAQSNVRVRLRQELAEHFSEEELRTLCFDLGLDYENLPAQGKVGKARELIAEVERGESVAKLVELCRRARPNVLWEDGAAAPRPDNLPGWFVELKARVCLGMGELLLEQSAPEALAWLNRGLDEFADVSSLEAAALHIRIGVVQIHIGNLPVARDALQHGLDILPAGPSQWRAAGLINLGAIYCAQGNSELGKKCYQRALEISQQLGDHWRVVSALHNLAIEMEITGHWEDAIAEYQTALALAERLGSHLHQANLALSLGILMTKRGDYESAETYLLNCQTIAREHSLRLELVFVLPSLADLYLLQGKTAVAVSLLAEAEHLALETGAEGRLAEIHRVWAEVHLTQDRPGMAQEAAQRSVNLARKLELQSEEGMSLRVLGQALISGDQQEAALAAFERSLSLLIDQDPYEASRTKVQLGVALITSGNTVRGMPLLYEARGWFERLGARCDLAALDAILQ